mgnify:CR=1 FL=1
MGYDEVKTRKSMMNRIQDFFNSIISIFIKKQKALPESSAETSEEYEKIREVYEEITANDTFENLEKTYFNYSVGTNTSGKTVAVEKNVGYVIEDPKFVARVRFVSIWRKSAIGNQDTKDEESSVGECFNEESKKIYEEIKNVIDMQLTKTGNIDTLEVLNKLKNTEYKWARSTSRRLFRNEIQTEIITDYFRSLIPKVKKQSKKTLTTSQALYGVDEEV